MPAYKSRFCPSPTGLLHLGNLRTALLNVLLAIKSGGTFILRIEDTDAERSKSEFSEAVCDDLEWMGLGWQEGPRVGGPEDSYYQSERNSIYKSFYEKLLEQDLIYPCFTSDEELKIIRRNQMAAGEPPRYTGIWADASEEEIYKAAKLSFSDEFINKLPRKYETLIGEDGVRLSGGEKQRISIARAMLKKSSIILLDEATSSLDSETETKIQDALKILTKDKTTIVIAHRLSTILNSNNIYVIDEGKVVGNGKHEELLAKSEIYKNFHEKQIQR